MALARGDTAVIADSKPLFSTTTDYQSAVVSLKIHTYQSIDNLCLRNGAIIGQFKITFYYFLQFTVTSIDKRINLN